MLIVNHAQHMMTLKMLHVKNTNSAFSKMEHLNAILVLNMVKHAENVA